MLLDLNAHCPCGSTNRFVDCCHRFIKTDAIASTPEALMRSRYTAYTIADIDYIRDTCSEEALKSFSYEDSLAWARDAQWQGLTVLNAPSPKGDQGTVEFKVLFTQSGLPKSLSEVSRFKRVDDQWYYTGSEKFRLIDVPAPLKVGRNDPCPCGSGKKFKKCCS